MINLLILLSEDEPFMPFFSYDLVRLETLGKITQRSWCHALFFSDSYPWSGYWVVKSSPVPWQECPGRPFCTDQRPEDEEIQGWHQWVLDQLKMIFVWFSHWFIHGTWGISSEYFPGYYGPQKRQFKECSTRMAIRSWSLLSFFTSEEAEPEEAQDVFSTSPELVAWSLMQISMTFRTWGVDH